MLPIKKVNTIKEYIAQFPITTQKKLLQLHHCIKKVVPKAEEVISYNMPAFKQQKVLVYYAGYEKHIGFYPTASPIKAFEKDIAKFKWSKGAIQFPLDQPLPIDLIEKIVQYRLNDVLQKETIKKVKTVSTNEIEQIKISAPAKKALLANNITTLQKLSKFSIESILKLHGIGPSAIPKLKAALVENGLNFKV